MAAKTGLAGTPNITAPKVNTVIVGGENEENLNGNIGNDTITGNGGDDIINGGAGNDSLNGGVGADTMNGGAGNDTYTIDNAGDTIVDPAAGGGTDTASTSVSYTLAANASVETLRILNPAYTAGLKLTGNNFANTLIGNAGANALDGMGGADTLQGLGGNDIYIVNHASDTIIEAANQGTDTVRSGASFTLKPGVSVENLQTLGATTTTTLKLVGNAFDNTITGNAGINTLDGAAGKDTINAGGGNDLVVGGLGTDAMTGGVGNDRFDFNSTAEIGNGATRDVIADFGHLIDKIDLATIDANGAAAGHAFSFLATKGAAFTGVAGQLRWFQQDSANNASDCTIVEGDIDGNRFADFQIQLAGLKTLTAADFFL